MENVIQTKITNYYGEQQSYFLSNLLKEKTRETENKMLTGNFSLMVFASDAVYPLAEPPYSFFRKLIAEYPLLCNYDPHFSGGENAESKTKLENCVNRRIRDGS